MRVVPATAQALILRKFSHADLVPKMEQAAVWFGAGQVHMSLARRKNRPQGSGVLSRKCSCRGSPNRLCVVHHVWHGFLAELPDGQQPWAHITAAEARRVVRLVLQRLQVSLLCACCGSIVAAALAC